MTKLTLMTRFDDGMIISFDSDDMDALVRRWYALADVRALAELDAAGLGPQVVPDAAPQQPAPADPWGQSRQPQAQSQGQTGGFRGPSPTPVQQQAPADAGTITVQTPNGLQVWTMNPGNAPQCRHGEPSALVHGTNKNGGAYNAYRCALGAGADWRNKCDFNQWV